MKERKKILHFMGCSVDFALHGWQTGALIIRKKTTPYEAISKS